MKKGLYIVATPIGNLGDISKRAIEVLEASEIVACEDTRVSKKLFSLLGIKTTDKSFIALHDHNESEVMDKIIGLAQDKIVSLVSDAGSPLISDPGYKLIRQARKENIYITTIPGACALISALQLSGLPSNRFFFAGFIPNKDKARKDFFSDFKNINATLIFYETAQRILKTLESAKDVYGNREMSVVREISKLYEECITGSADYIIDIFSKKEPKGEFVFLVSPPEEESISITDIKNILKDSMKTKTLKASVDEVSKEYNLSKKEVYQLALEVRDE